MWDQGLPLATPLKLCPSTIPDARSSLSVGDLWELEVLWRSSPTSHTELKPVQ